MISLIKKHSFEIIKIFYELLIREYTQEQYTIEYFELSFYLYELIIILIY